VHLREKGGEGIEEKPGYRGTGSRKKVLRLTKRVEKYDCGREAGGRHWWVRV